MSSIVIIDPMINQSIKSEVVTCLQWYMDIDETPKNKDILSNTIKLILEIEQFMLED